MKQRRKEAIRSGWLTRKASVNFLAVASTGIGLPLPAATPLIFLDETQRCPPPVKLDRLRTDGNLKPTDGYAGNSSARG